MAEKTWEPIKVQYCHHVKKPVSLEAQVVFPADILPDQPPRIEAHRCSDALACSLNGAPACIWAGTNPTVDPFSETQNK